MPPYEVREDEARAIVMVVAHGRIDQPLAVEMVTAARKASLARGWNILYDLRDSTPGDMSSGALFWMPRQVGALQGAQARRTRVALLHPLQFAAMATYWEDAFGNAGLTARAFTDEAGAVAWLGGEA